MRRALAAVILLCGCAHGAVGATATEDAATLAPEHVVAVSITGPRQVKVGSRAVLQLRLSIASGYHVMSDRPSRPEYIATAVQFAPAPGLIWGALEYPPAQRFALGDQAIATFTDAVIVHVPFEVAEDAAAGSRALVGELAYQACTHASCLFPVRRPLETQIEVVR